MDFLKCLNDGYEQMGNGNSKAEHLATGLFNIDTGGGFDELYVTKILEVMTAMKDGKTFEYIRKSEENNFWLVNVLNLSFFKNRYDYGVAIRGAWFEHTQPPMDVSILWENGRQVVKDVVMNETTLKKFIEALNDFYHVPELKNDMDSEKTSSKIKP